MDEKKKKRSFLRYIVLMFSFLVIMNGGGIMTVSLMTYRIMEPAKFGTSPIWMLYIPAVLNLFTLLYMIGRRYKETED